MAKKQTVQERYEIEKKMRLTEKVNQNPVEENVLQQIFTQTLQALGGASQAVRQAQMTNPTEVHLKRADARLSHAMREFQRLKSDPNIAALTQGFPTQTQQQINQLFQQLNQASETLQTIQTSTSSN